MKEQINNASSSSLNKKKMIATAAVIGGAMASSGGFVAWGATQSNDLNSQTPEEQNNNSDANANDSSEQSQELSEATSVSDKMTFAQAFAAAREELGPGGVFEWNGKLYGTFYKEEWDSMTPEEKAEYNHAVNEYIKEHPIENEAKSLAGIDTLPKTNEEVKVNDTLLGMSENGEFDDTDTIVVDAEPLDPSEYETIEVSYADDELVYGTVEEEPSFTTASVVTGLDYDYGMADNYNIDASQNNNMDLVASETDNYVDQDHSDSLNASYDDFNDSSDVMDWSS